MKRSALLLAGVIALAVSPSLMADGRKPGSVLVYPIHRSGNASPDAPNANFFTLVSITNTNLIPANQFQQGGTTKTHFEYVNITPNMAAGMSKEPLACNVENSRPILTPADTLTVLTSCHNPAANKAGYLVVSALDPNFFNAPWAFDYLIGSELVVAAQGTMYSLNAVPFFAGDQYSEGDHTDFNGDMGAFPGGVGPGLGDGDGQLDFDGIEYEQMPAELYIDSFVALGGSALTLINFTGGSAFTATVTIDIFNDNEQCTSVTFPFRCWFEERLADISLNFTDQFLQLNMMDSPFELDINCDGMDDLQTGWARIKPVSASSTGGQTIQNPVFLGAITAGPGGPLSAIDGGHLLWESVETRDNGDFHKTATFDSEAP